MNRETLDSYKIDLVQAKYMTEYWDGKKSDLACTCLLYTSDAADE